MKHLILLLAILLNFSAFAQVQEIDDIWDIKYNNRPMVVDVYATWCAPCRTYKPIFNRVAREYEGRVDFYRMDADGPDAQSFIEISSVPTTVFIWDPKGDATVQYSEERGLMSYSELKQYVENTLAKQYKFEARSVSSLNWDDFSPSGLKCTPTFADQLYNFVGVWECTENGHKTRLYVSKDDDFSIYGGTLDPERQRLTDTVYWFALGAEWNNEINALCISDVLPDTPTGFSLPKIGILHEREFRYNTMSDNVEMTVRQYHFNNGHCDNTPFNTYTATLYYRQP